jgi:serine/threonine protein kinase
MTAGRPNLDTLPAADLARLEDLLIDFDQTWSASRLDALLASLTLGDPLRLPALVEMIKIDLERHRKDGRTVALADYLRRYPELGTPASVHADLILAEYRVDRQFGTASGVSEFLERYPVRTEELRALLSDEDDSLSLSTIGSPHREPRQALRGQFGRYRIERLLGRGGMGAVYLAHDPELDRLVALKVPDLDRADGELRKRFQREACAAAALHHPNLCPVYDVGQNDGIPFLTMAFIDGEPLAHLLQRDGPLPPERALSLTATVARALAFAHQHGVVHRDLKPANILLDRTAQPMVVDFGLARRDTPEQSPPASTGLLIGSPPYMAPEQVSSRFGPVGPRADVYALGVVLYELLTGRPPFQGTMSEVLASILTEEVVPPSRRRPGLPARLDALCARAMARNQADRYPTMQALADALDQPTRALRRRWPIVATAAVALALAMSIGAIGLARMNRPEPPLDPLPQPGQVVEGKKDPPAKVQVSPEVEGLLRELESKDALRRLEATRKLAGHRDKAVVAALPKRFDDPHWSVRREAAHSLGRIGDPDAVPALIARVADEKWMTERWGLEPGEKFSRWASDPKQGGKDAALDALRVLAPARVVEALVQALRSGRKDRGFEKEGLSRPGLVRAWAAERLADCTGPEVVPALIEALRDDYPLVRRRAAESLGKLADRSAAGALAARVADERWLSPRRCRLTGAAFAEEFADPQWGGKQAALTALRMLSPEQAAAALKQAAVSKDAGVRAWAEAQMK